MNADQRRQDRTPWVLLGVFGLFVLIGAAAAARFGMPATNQSTWVDLSNASLVEIRDARGTPVLTGEFRSRTDALGNIEKDAALSDREGRNVVGEVEIEVPGPQAMTTTQELELDIIRIAPQGSFAVFIDDVEVATFMTDDRGSVDVEWTGSPAQ